MKKSDQMKALLAVMITASTELMNKDGVTAAEINAKAAEIETLKAKIAMQETIETQERAELGNSTAEAIKPATGTTEDANAAYKTAFYNAIAGKALTAEQKELLIKNALASASGEDGGYLIPVDQQVAVKELMRKYESLDELVTIETVTTLTGSRNMEKDAQYTEFANLTEGETIPDTDGPQFVNIPFAIKDYAGILPVPNNLLNDSVALQKHINKWLAKKNVATRNAIIRSILNTLTKTAITGLDSVKTVLNVVLDVAISESSFIIMNQDSFNKFDLMKDSDGKPLLQPMVTDPTKLMIAGKVIKKYSNKVLPTRVGATGTADEGKKFAPVIIGNLEEAVTIFDRQAMSLLATNIGAGAFEKNQTKTRAILRLDGKKFDGDAAVFGEIEV